MILSQSTTQAVFHSYHDTFACSAQNFHNLQQARIGTYSQQKLPIPGEAAAKKGSIASNLTPTQSTSLAEYIRQLSEVFSVREDPFSKSSGSRQSCNWLQPGAVVLPRALCQSETINGNYTFKGFRCIGYSHGGRNVDIAMIRPQLQTRQLIGDGALQSLA